MKLDPVIVHADNLGKTVGEFYGTPIREVDMLAIELREILDSQLSARISLGEGAAHTELLPGEIVKDNIIRRFTTAEAVGEEFYDKAVPEGRKVPINDVPEDALVTYRPNNEDYAIVHEEVAE